MTEIELLQKISDQLAGIDAWLMFIFTLLLLILIFKGDSLHNKVSKIESHLEEIKRKLSEFKNKKY